MGLTHRLDNCALKGSFIDDQRDAAFADKAESAKRLQAFIRERNEVAHPFAWSTKATAEVMAKCEPEPPAKPDEFRLAA